MAELAKEENEFLEYVKWKAELKGQVGIAGNVVTKAGMVAPAVGPQVVKGEKVVEQGVGGRSVQ